MTSEDPLPVPDIVARLSGGAFYRPWHIVVAHDRGATFEARCGEVLWPCGDADVDGLRVTDRVRLVNESQEGVRITYGGVALCPRCFPPIGVPDPRRFRLVRDVDETGVSGTGRVADGVRFPDGTCVLRWLTATTSTAVYGSIEDVETIHGHGGQTRIEWLDP